MGDERHWIRNGLRAGYLRQPRLATARGIIGKCTAPSGHNNCNVVATVGGRAEIESMAVLQLIAEMPPLAEDQDGVLRVGGTRVQYWKISSAGIRQRSSGLRLQPNRAATRHLTEL